MGLLIGIYWYSHSFNFDKVHFDGVIISKYENYPCHGNIVIQSKNNIDTVKELNECTDSISAIYRSAVIGDTIIKNEGSDTIMLQRNGKTIKFHYPNEAG
jgi:hypothetical protein